MLEFDENAMKPVEKVLDSNEYEWREDVELDEDSDFVYMEIDTREDIYNDLLELSDYLPVRCFAIMNHQESYRVAVEKNGL